MFANGLLYLSHMSVAVRLERLTAPALACFWSKRFDLLGGVGGLDDRAPEMGKHHLICRWCVQNGRQVVDMHCEVAAMAVATCEVFPVRVTGPQEAQVQEARGGGREVRTGQRACS